MSSIVQSIQKMRANQLSIPLSQTDSSKETKQPGQGLRRRLSSLSLKMQPSPEAKSWAFQRSKSLCAMGENAGSSIRKWWDLTWSWILSTKPVFAKDLELNEEETKTLGSHEKGSWKHVLYKIRSEFRKIIRSSDKVGLPQTYRYRSFSYSKNFDIPVRD